MREYLMEFIGAFFLTLAIALTGNPFAAGIMLMIMVYLGGHISGGHYNPAVTLSVWMRGKLAGEKVAKYMLSQLVGAFAAAALYFAYAGKTFFPNPNASVGIWGALVIEMLFTLVLCMTVLTFATTRRFAGNPLYGLAIGFSLLVGAFAGGPLSGGAFNPAVGLGPIIFDIILGGASANFIALYLFGPFLGGALAAVLFKVLNPKER